MRLGKNARDASCTEKKLTRIILNSLRIAQNNATNRVFFVSFGCEVIDLKVKNR